METIVCRQISWGSAAYRQALDLRQRVLRKPLGLDLFREDLQAEKAYFHFAAFDGDRMIATLLLVPRGLSLVQMKQVAVMPDCQGKGLGGKLLLCAENFCLERGIAHIVLDARKTATGFYEKFGYLPTGPEFIEVSLPHFPMEKQLF